MTSLTSNISPKPRLVCPECGSPNLSEEAFGRRTFEVTYYADGSYDIRGDASWETDSWTNTCNSCGAHLSFDQLVIEAAGQSART